MIFTNINNNNNRALGSNNLNSLPDEIGDLSNLTRLLV